MTIIEKIKQSVEGATGMPFLYHAAGELNELIARCQSLPVAYSFLIDSGTIDDVNGRYHERVTLAVMFCDKTEFDFNALENEGIIDRMKVKAYKWLQSLRMSNTLRIVSINSTQRLYDNTTDILTGFAVNITIDDLAGVGECELPEVVFEIKENGEYDVVGIDKVIVDVLPRLEELTITQNGEYLPSEGVAGFSKVVAEFDTSSLPKVKVSAFRVTNACINADGIWEGEKTIDTSECTLFNDYFSGVSAMKKINVSNFDTRRITSMHSCFNKCTSLTEIIGLENWDTSNVTNLSKLFYKDKIESGLDGVKNWNVKKVKNADGVFYGVRQDSLTLNWDLSSCTTIKECFSTANIKYLDLHNCNVSNISNFVGIFNGSSITELDITGWDLSNATSVSYMLNAVNLTTLIGGKTEYNVISNNISTLIGLKLSIGLHYTPNIDRASIRAVINGLADLTGQTSQTLTLGATLLAKLTEEDIAIATNKNWTIA